jgi:hypothetical protein
MPGPRRKWTLPSALASADLPLHPIRVRANAALCALAEAAFDENSALYPHVGGPTNGRATAIDDEATGRELARGDVGRVALFMLDHAGSHARVLGSPTLSTDHLALNVSNSKKCVTAAKKAAESTSDLPTILATVDSGNTATLTQHCDNLINKRPCDEIFGQADGLLTRATCIGTMPVIARADDGQIIRFSFTNVRCVPKFKFTLLSVTQMWMEQRIHPQFADLSRLMLPPSAGSGNLTIPFVPYDEDVRLPTMVFVSDARLSKHDRAVTKNTAFEMPPPASASSTGHNALLALGFHSVSSISQAQSQPGVRASPSAEPLWERQDGIHFQRHSRRQPVLQPQEAASVA